IVDGLRGVHSSHLQRRVGLVLGAAGNPCDGVDGTDQARQAHGAAEARVDAQLHFRQTDLGAFGHDAVVRGQAHFQAATQGDAVDGDHGGNVQVFEIVEDPVGFEVGGDQLGLGQLAVVDEVDDVGAEIGRAHV